MVSTFQHGPVTVLHMGRSIGKFILYPVHAFIIGDTMIDTGPRCVRPELADVLANMRIHTVVNTHHHEDHTGNNRLLQEKYGAVIYAPEGAVPYLADPRKLCLRSYQRVLWDCPEPSSAIALPEAITIGRYLLRVILSPGHTPSHICLHEPREGWLFTGDLFCGKIFKYLRLDENYPVILSTLKKLVELDFNTIFCSLKGVVEDGKAALIYKISFMERLRDDVLELHDRGLAPEVIRKKLLGEEGLMKLITGGHYAKINTVKSIIHKIEPERL